MPPSFEIVHKYCGDMLPYRWEIQQEILPKQFVWIGTISLDARDILNIDAMSEHDLSSFFFAKVIRVMGQC